MRLLVINWQDPANPRAGGAEVHLREIFGRLAAWGHQVTLLASGWRNCRRFEVVEGLEVHRVGGRHSFAIRAPLYYRQVLAARRFDVVIEDVNKIPLYVPTWTRRPVVVIAHHLFGSSAFGAASIPIATVTWMLEQTLGPAYRGVPVQAVSESTAEDLCRHGLRDEDITVIRNGVDLDCDVPSRGARAAEPTFLYLGRLQRYKRVDLILRAVAKLSGQLPSVRLIIAGRGPEEPRLKDLARALGVDSRVDFVGFVTEASKRELLTRAWANVLMSTKEGWGITVLEAGAVGTPTVASVAPGLRDAVRDGATGLLVRQADATALADALARLARDGEYARSLGQAARRLAERSTWERAAQQTEAHLSAVVNGTIGPAGNPLRLRHRDQRSPVPLPRNGTEGVPFGCTWFWVDGQWEGRSVRMRLVLGAKDPRGDEPTLVLGHLECSDSDSRSSLVRLKRRLESVRWLDGWPADPVAFITLRLEQLLGGRWQIDNQARAYTPGLRSLERAVPWRGWERFADDKGSATRDVPSGCR